jgi:hypothetical protein
MSSVLSSVAAHQIILVFAVSYERKNQDMACRKDNECRDTQRTKNDNSFALTGIREASNKIMLPGCGKTSLDGMFGILGQHLSRLVYLLEAPRKELNNLLA